MADSTDICNLCKKEPVSTGTYCTKCKLFLGRTPFSDLHDLALTYTKYETKLKELTELLQTIQKMKPEHVDVESFLDFLRSQQVK